MKDLLQGAPIRKAWTAETDEFRAIEELSRQLDSATAKSSILFISSHYDRSRLTEAIARFMGPHVVACTTAGELSPAGYVEHSISGISFHGDAFNVETIPIDDVQSLSVENSAFIGERVSQVRKKRERLGETAKCFSILLIDGLSGREEVVAGLLSKYLLEIPLVGGSAGDDLLFRRTYVYSGGRFLPNAAVLVLVTTTLPFEVFKAQHFRETDKKVVITASDPETRTVYEIDGERATESYAQALGLDVAGFGPQVFSRHPLMLRVGNDYYVRSIQKANPDGSLSFFCAIDDGLVLTLAEPENFVQTLERLFGNIRSRFESVDCSLIFECVLRRLEVLAMSEERKKKIVEIFRENSSIGFHTYGEQFGSLHINQTVTGVVFGKPRRD